MEREDAKELRATMNAGIKEMLKSKDLAPVFLGKMKEFEEEFKDSQEHIRMLYERRKLCTTEDQLSWQDWAIRREIARRDKIKAQCVRWSIYHDQCLGRPVPAGLNIEQAKSVPLHIVLGIDERECRHNICCPVHKDKTPSFHVYRKDNKAKCFGCNWHGDSIDLYMAINNTDFKSAVKALNSM